jgi:hypothetical protein
MDICTLLTQEGIIASAENISRIEMKRLLLVQVCRETKKSCFGTCRALVIDDQTKQGMMIRETRYTPGVCTNDVIPSGVMLALSEDGKYIRRRCRIVFVAIESL